MIPSNTFSGNQMHAPQQITLYGIAHCDTVKKARAWLTARGLTHAFHDFKKIGLAESLLDAWMSDLPWERLLNRQGMMWRKLSDEARASVVDAASARAVMLAHPSIIKRPVVHWPDDRLTIGFDVAHWTARL